MHEDLVADDEQLCGIGIDHDDGRGRVVQSRRGLDIWYVGEDREDSHYLPPDLYCTDLSSEGW